MNVLAQRRLQIATLERQLATLKSQRDEAVEALNQCAWALMHPSHPKLVRPALDAARTVMQKIHPSQALAAVEKEGK